MCQLSCDVTLGLENRALASLQRDLLISEEAGVRWKGWMDKIN